MGEDRLGAAKELPKASATLCFERRGSIAVAARPANMKMEDEAMSASDRIVKTPAVCGERHALRDTNPGSGWSKHAA